MDTIQSNPFADKLAKVRTAFEAMQEAEIQGDLGELLAEFMQDRANHQIFAEMLMQMPVARDYTNPDSGPDKRFALDVAETIGPDWAQAWYRFVVMVTKLA